MAEEKEKQETKKKKTTTTKKETQTTTKKTKAETQTTKTKATTKKAVKKETPKEEIEKDPIVEEIQEEGKLDEIVNEVVKKEIAKKEKQDQKVEELENALEEAKKSKKSVQLSEEQTKQLETLKQVLKEKKQLSRPETLQLNEIVFFNLGAAVLVIVYFILINQLYFQLEKDIFLKELCLFSSGFLFVTILLFEFAYKRDSGKIAVTSAEFLALAVVSMILVYLDSILEETFSTIVPLIAVAFAIYYLIKSIVQYIKKRNEYWVKNAKEEMEKE